MIIGWYKMEGPAGTKLPEQIIQNNHCGTNNPGWLNGDHPTTLNAIVDREVCFTSDSDFCAYRNQIQIRNCGDFYLYYFTPTTSGFCLFRYCSK